MDLREGARVAGRDAASMVLDSTQRAQKNAKTATGAWAISSLRPWVLGMFFFAGLAALARADEFDLPRLDEGRIRAAGIRRLEGKHITLYTDLPAAKDVDELPRVFDAAVPLWCGYFGIDPAKAAQWKLVGSVMKEKEPYVATELYPASLPDFPHGYSMGSQVWVYEQPSDYYRRHLLLHEGTHAFMARWLGGGGPPWYMEGMAELLGTHQWSGSKLTLGVMPKTREEVPYWGRVKIVKDDMAAGKGKSLQEIMQYDSRAHLQVEAYGWCWAAAAFLDQHPLTQAAFRELKADTRTRSLAFSRPNAITAMTCGERRRFARRLWNCPRPARRFRLQPIEAGNQRA